MDRNAVDPGYKLTHTRRFQFQPPPQSGASVVAGRGSASVTIKYTVVVSGACALLSPDRGVCELPVSNQFPGSGPNPTFHDYGKPTSRACINGEDPPTTDINTIENGPEGPPLDTAFE